MQNDRDMSELVSKYKLVNKDEATQVFRHIDHAKSQSIQKTLQLKQLKKDEIGLKSELHKRKMKVEENLSMKEQYELQCYHLMNDLSDQYYQIEILREKQINNKYESEITERQK